MANRNNRNSDSIFLGFKITADGDCGHEIKRHLLLGKKAMTNLDGICMYSVCMQEYMCVCMHSICVHMCIDASICVCLYVYAYIGTGICICFILCVCIMFIHVCTMCMCPCMCRCVYVCILGACIYTCMCCMYIMCIYVCISCACICVYTYIKAVIFL